ncbi:DAD family-domain-containing protein [Kockovaella imperatae]|uniref:Dolichyl-diphosphooligosaccharide--protein glycosyltransferase subunit OST2 n=1 Tax=Kockovaella imperatae TaxID=4999 RepID=A0A1Y1UAI6_9TREE|nr:DAD family-domain-containing protein [Kockovaella imperatae]ORX35053.1 DAD family-domain-containing protein [Kockovaella imperatae]
MSKSSTAASSSGPSVGSSNSSSSVSSNTSAQFQNSISTLVANYSSSTPPRLKLIDSFLLFCLLSGGLQMAYRILVTSYPYNSFLGGFGSTVGQFVLLAGLRSQVAPGRDAEFKEVSKERAFADFCAASIILHLFAVNFLG